MLLKRIILFLFSVSCTSFLLAQNDYPKDYLTPSFHIGRREAARAMMPDHSVKVVFAAPVRNFSNDENYVYHQNPDLYYFTGYKEPNSVLFIFKDMQTGNDGKTFNELFFIQKRNPQEELWTGKRAGIERTKVRSGISEVYNGEDFKNFPLHFSAFSKVILNDLPEDVSNTDNDPVNLYHLIKIFKEKTGIPSDFSSPASADINRFIPRITPTNLNRVQNYLQTKVETDSSYRNNKLVQEVLNLKDSTGLESLKSEVSAQRFNNLLFST